MDTLQREVAKVGTVSGGDESQKNGTSNFCVEGRRLFFFASFCFVCARQAPAYQGFKAIDENAPEEKSP